MFKKLRIKFIALIMCSVAVVLAVMFTGICINEQRSSAREVDEALESALGMAIRENEMHFDFAESEGQPQWTEGEWRSTSSASSSSASTSSDGYRLKQNSSGSYGAEPPRIGKGERAFNSLVPVATYRLTDESTLSVVPGATTASISSDALSQAAEEVVASTQETGRLADLGLCYAKRTVDGVTYLSFADTAYLDGWQSLALSLTLGGLGVLAVFFVLSLFFSKWALKPVREAWDSQRQFIADASHELKTPLTVMLANSSILLKHPEDSIASQSQWIESTQVEAESMQQLVNEMLQLAQVEERAALTLVPLDFSDLVDGVTLQFESVAFEEGLVFVPQVKEGITVEGDSTRLRKMTSTLIENALKYAGEGGTVVVNLSCKNKQAVLAITNTGTTISPEDLPHIFDRFYRTDKARTSGTGGFGLGLAIAREIARAHNGDITCTSDAESGTTFTVTLPAAPLPK